MSDLPLSDYQLLRKVVRCVRSANEIIQFNDIDNLVDVIDDIESDLGGALNAIKELNTRKRNARNV